MNYSTFQTAMTGTLPADPSKHVKYTQGMVLGVDDFTQEFAYLSNRDQWLARDAIGYGTVSGLHVALDVKGGDTEVSVSPGVAINPRGQFIRVAPRQCARIGAWLALPATQSKLTEQGLSASSELTAYVVLCYRDCPVDELPVPGEPCRCDSETMAPSRILDDFRLELTLTPPPQLEEDAVREFVTWLRAVVIADFDPAPGDLDAFLDALREATGGLASPPGSASDFFSGSPPEFLRIPRSQVCEWMRAAMRLWITELRPLWQAQCAPQKTCGGAGPCGCHGTGEQPEEMACECVLLAELRLTRIGAVVTDATLDEERRPFLVHLRMLQELLLCGPCICGAAETGATSGSLGGDVTGAFETNLVEGIQGFPVDLNVSPGDGTVLGFNGTRWHLTTSPALPQTPQPSNLMPLADGTATPGASLEYARADHVHPLSAIPAGDFVEHPPGLPRYFIVAAGIIGNQPLGASYNNLKAVAFTLGTLTISFDGFVIPGPNHQYITKAMYAPAEPGTRPVLVQFRKFSQQGIQLEIIRPDGTRVPADEIRRLTFVIEVSQFFAP